MTTKTTTMSWRKTRRSKHLTQHKMTTYEWLRLGIIRFQIKPFDSIPDSDFKPNRFVCQEIKSLKFRIDLISIILKRIEFDQKEYEKILLISSLSCVANIYIYICIVLYGACAHKPKIFFCENYRAKS
jgi:hypothetical protein